MNGFVPHCMILDILLYCHDDRHVFSFFLHPLSPPPHCQCYFISLTLIKPLMAVHILA